MKTNNFIPLVLFIIVLTFANTFVAFGQDTSNKFVVVLDAGHGGKDPGRPTKYGFKEKNIALKVVLKLGKKLEKDSTIQVIYTRKIDVFLELHERAAIANKADADLFISIHCNAWKTSQPYGTETYVLGAKNTKRNFDIAKAENEVIFLEDNYEKHYEGFNPNSPESLIGLTLMQEEYVDQSILLASLVENNFSKKLRRKSRGVKQISLWVLHNTYMPSVLIETGFITNIKEGKYLNSKKGQDELSSSILSAILEYKNNLDQNQNDVIAILNEENEIATTTNDEPQEVLFNIIFKVQIAASTRDLETKPYNFKGLNNISRDKVGRIFKYFYGETSDFNKIKVLKTDAKKKGYKSSFIVAYKDGKKIPLAQALKSVKD
jgi:N-acetylmuramoyl-L-alanine amidase